jgi:hypothetical protein
MKQYEEYVNTVKKGQAGRLVPQQGETARGVVMRVGRAAKRLGKSTEAWVADGVVYFRVD